MKKKIILITALLLIVLVLSLLIASAFSLARSEPENFVGGGSSGGSSNSSSGGSSGADTESGGSDNSGENSSGGSEEPIEPEEGSGQYDIVLPETFEFSYDGSDYVVQTSNNLLAVIPGQKTVMTCYNAAPTVEMQKTDALMVFDDGMTSIMCEGFTDRFLLGNVKYFGSSEYAFFYREWGSNEFHLICSGSPFSLSFDGKYYSGDHESFTNKKIAPVFNGMTLVEWGDNVKVYVSDSDPAADPLPSTVFFYLFELGY